MVMKGFIVFLFCLLGFANSVQAQNYITITLYSYAYDCSSGKVSVSFHISNTDQFGQSGFYHTIYSVNAGISQQGATSLPTGESDLNYTGAYHPGDLITISAYGLSNNDAPLTSVYFSADGGSPPAKPGISFTSSFLCNGQSATLTANGSGNTYVWSTGQTGNSITVNTAGSYTVHESGPCGVSSESDPVVINTGNTPGAPVINYGTTLLCNGASTTLTTSPSTGGTIYWNTGQAGNSISVSVGGGFYAYEYNVCGQGANSAIVNLTTGYTPPAPTVSSSLGTLLCNGVSTTLSTSPSSGGTINWNTGATGNSIVTNQPGTFYAYEINSCGTGGNSNSIVLSTLSTPAAPTILPAGPVSLCNGSSTTLTASGTGNITWYLNSGQYGASGTSLTTSAAGSYTVYASNSCGISGSSNAVTVVTNQTPPAPSLSADGTITLCDGASQVISTTPSTTSGIIHWSTGATGNSITVSAAGNYYAYESNGNCGNGPNSATVSINTLSRPAAPVVTPSGNQLLCNGQLATLSSSGYSVTWSNGATGNSLVTGIAGTYYAYDHNYCGNSANSNAVVISTGICPQPSPGSNFMICPGSVKTLDAGAGYDTYQWSTGQTTQTIAVGPGNYSVTVTKQGCTVSSAIVTVAYYSVTAPVVNASGPITFCSGGSVVLSSSPGAAYLWSKGASTGTINVSSSGTYYVTVTDVNGCQSVSNAKTVTVNPLPSASVSGSTSVCQNSALPSITFTGSNATAPYTFTYKINNGSSQTTTTTSGNSVSINVPTATAGTYTYSLLSVQESGSSTSCSNTANGSATVVVNPLPTATIAGSTSVCQNASAPLITFTGTGGTAPYTFTYKINNGTSQTITTTSGNSVSIPAPTNSAGTYVYSLLSVQESSSTNCSNAASETATITVNPLPSASIAGSATVCQNEAPPSITFTGNGATAPYTFTYQINNGNSQTISTTAGNSISIPATTNSAGTYTYNLLGVSESSALSCYNTASGVATINVNPQPVSAVLVTAMTHLCNGDTVQITINNWVNGFAYTWYKDGNQLIVSSSNYIKVTQAGTYTVMVRSDKGCDAATISNAIVISTGTVSTPVITGYLKVCKGGQTNLLVIPKNSSMAYEKYRWTDRDIGDSVFNQKSFSAFAGRYQVLVARQGCFDSAIVAVRTTDTGFPSGRLQVSPNKISYGERVSLVAAVTDAVQYQWDLGDSLRAVTFSNSLHQNYYVQSDSLPIKVRAVSAHNCITEFTSSLKVGARDTMVIPDHSFTGNLKDWNVFPVPFHNECKLSVILQRNQAVRVDLFTVEGKWVRSWQYKGIKGENLFLLDRITDLPTGIMYLITGVYNGEKHYDKIYRY